jgi:hypothetical protein
MYHSYKVAPQDLHGAIRLDMIEGTGELDSLSFGMTCGLE